MIVISLEMSDEPLFCQNTVKKNCKFVPRVSFKVTYMKFEEMYVGICQKSRK